MTKKEFGSYAARPDYWAAVSESQWGDWHWQLANRITSLDVLEQVIELSDQEKEIVAKSLNSLRMAITPYYAGLMDAEDPHCPVRMRAVPTIHESQISPEDLFDALHEDEDSPTPGITHRYPDRVLFLITDQCSMYCRHCTRRRYAGELDQPRKQDQIDNAIAYIRETKGVRDVLLSGGDAFTLSTDRLEYIVAKLSEIPHVEMIRYGTATPIVLPQRIDDKLVNMLKKYQPVWVNVHFNHPKELTARSRQALAKLADAGIALGNQSVLMRGLNDCPYIMKELVQRLVRNRVRPYRLYQCDLARGIGHFRTSIAKGLEIMEHLVGHTTGFAVPIYTVDLPGGGGKVPVNPHYMIGQSDRVVIFRNYEGVIAKYVEPEETSSPGCPETCLICEDREARGLDTPKVGLEKLYAEEDTISLEPIGLERNKRKDRTH
ncbi:MAG TPA: lysine 2,3-aminomutase [Anaerolineales bacterium]|nr:lysine 2,3-aminomutase [Anaerolineales bacterium]